MPTEGSRPDTATLPLAAEPQSAPVPTATPPGRQVAGRATRPEGIVVDPVTRTVAVAKRNPNELVLLDADTGADPRPDAAAGLRPPPAARRSRRAGAGAGGERERARSASTLPGGQAAAPLVRRDRPHDATQAPNGTVLTADELGGTVSAVRGTTRSVKVFTDAVQPAGLAPVGDLVGLVDVRKNDLTIYNVATLSIVGSAPSGAGPTHLVADRHGRMIATDTRGTRSSCSSRTRAARPPRSASCRSRAARTGSPTTRRATGCWVASSGTNEVIGYDMTNPQPREVARIATVQNPYTVGVDPQTGRLYVAGVSGGVVQFVDPPA